METLETVMDIVKTYLTYLTSFSLQKQKPQETYLTSFSLQKQKSQDISPG